MPTKKQIITIGVLCVIALGLGYWSGMPEKGSGQRAELLTPTVVTNVVTNTLKEVVTNVVEVQPKPKPTPFVARPIPAAAKHGGSFHLKGGKNELRHSLANHQLTDVKSIGKLQQAATKRGKFVTAINLDNNQLTDVTGLEELIHLKELRIYNNQLTDVTGLEKLTQLRYLNLAANQLTDLRGLEKLTQLETLWITRNQLVDVMGLKKLTKLKSLNLSDNPDLTKVQIAELQKALPNCNIQSNPTK